MQTACRETMTTGLNYHHFTLNVTFLFATSTMGVVHMCARVCVCALTICWDWEGGGLSYPSAYLHQNDWLCCQQWSWPRFERQSHAVWLKATRPCKYYGCTFICGPHCVWKELFEAAVWLTKQVQGLSPVAAANERQYSLQFSTIICI